MEVNYWGQIIHELTIYAGLTYEEMAICTGLKKSDIKSLAISSYKLIQRENPQALNQLQDIHDHYMNNPKEHIRAEGCRFWNNNLKTCEALTENLCLTKGKCSFRKEEANEQRLGDKNTQEG